MTGRISIVAHSVVNGGAEKYLRMLYEGAPATLYGSIPEWQGARVDVDLSPKWGKKTLATGLLRLPGERKRVAAALRGEPRGISHVQFKREQIGFSRGLSLRGPVVWTEHGVFEGAMRAALGSVYARASRYASAIICVSQEVADSIGDLVHDQTKLHVIENPVDATSIVPPTASERADARAQLGIDGATPLAAWVGRLDLGKRPLLAAEIGRSWDGQLLIAGDGPLRSQIVDGDGVRALGFVDPTTLYRAADVLLMTSDGSAEGLPNNVLLESSAHGVPAVVDGRVTAFRRVATEAGSIAVLNDSEWTGALTQAVRETDRRAQVRTWAEAHDIAPWRQRHFEIFESLEL